MFLQNFLQPFCLARKKVAFMSTTFPDCFDGGNSLCCCWRPSTAAAAAVPCCCCYPLLSSGGGGGGGHFSLLPQRPVYKDEMVRRCASPILTHRHASAWTSHKRVSVWSSLFPHNNTHPERVVSDREYWNYKRKKIGSNSKQWSSVKIQLFFLVFFKPSIFSMFVISSKYSCSFH